MILCADDYALNDPVSKGILNLLRKKRINALSCLTVTSCWKKRAKDLNPFLKKTQIGLHLSLTRPQPFIMKRRSLPNLAGWAFLRLLDKKKIIQEMKKQIENFQQTLGCAPDYLDGHEFCHHLPVVREALIETASAFSFKENNVYIRVFCPGSLPRMKGIFFILRLLNFTASLPSKKLNKQLRQMGIRSNNRLLGFHPIILSPEKYFDWYLSAKPGEKDIFFCHPGLLSDDLSDPLRNFRPKIHSFLMSSSFDKMLKKHKLSLTNCVKAPLAPLIWKGKGE